MQAIHVADFFFPHCSALSPAPLYVSSALAKHSFSMLCPCRTLPCYALRCLRPAMPCPSLPCPCHGHAKLLYAFALLSVALPCYALALLRHAKPIFAMPSLCDANLCTSVSGLAFAVLCCPLPCLAFAMLVRAQLCNALAVPCHAKRIFAMPLLCPARVSFPRFASETAIFRRPFVCSALCSAKSALPPPSIFGVHTVTQPVGQTFVPHNRTAQPLLRLCLCLAVQCFPSQCLCSAMLFLASLCPCCAFLSHAIRCYALALPCYAELCPCAYSKMSENSAALSSRISQRNLPLPLLRHCPSPRSLP